MSRSLPLALFWCLFCVVYKAKCSEIVFTADPLEVKEGLTDSLTLRCVLRDTSASASVVGKRDVNHTDDNAAEVSSVVIMRNGIDIASVTHGYPAQMTNGSSSEQVSGSVAGSPGERGFIQVTFDVPSKSLEGEFFCEINALRGAHVTTYTSSLEVQVLTPSIGDLVQVIREMKAKEKKDIADLKNKTETAVFFSALHVNSKALSIRAGEVVVYDKVVSNVGASYDPTTGLFVCDVPGFYEFSLSSLSETGEDVDLDLYKNNERVISAYAMHSHGYQSASNSVIIHLANGDVVKVVSDISSSDIHYSVQHYTTFSGQLIFLD